MEAMFLKKEIVLKNKKIRTFSSGKTEKESGQEQKILFSKIEKEFQKTA